MRLEGKGMTAPQSARITALARGNDLAAVAHIHIVAFPGFFLTQLGYRFVREYYRLVYEYDDGILIVARDGGTPSGFAAGFLDPPRFHRFMIAHSGRLATLALMAVLARPSLLASCAKAVRRVAQASRTTSFQPPAPFVELSSIAVLPSSQGLGSGRKLVARFCWEAGQREARFIRLKTDAVGNERTNLFYVEAGFRRVGSVIRSDGRKMNVYWGDSAKRTRQGQMMKPLQNH
ncbi:MAG: GNAT family N-acetyltransferase [Thermoleophilia bacterium]